MKIQSMPKFAQVAEAITRDILPDLREGTKKLPSEISLAKRFGVSTITISKALASLDAKGLVERIGGSGTYARQPSATVPPRASRVVGAVMPTLLEGHQELALHLPRALQMNHYVACIFDGDNPAALEATMPDFLRGCPSGLVVDGNSLFPFHLLDALAAETRLVFASHFEGPRRYNASYVLFDHQGKGRQAVSQLLRLGRRRVAVVNMEIHPGWSSDLFWQGCQAAFREAGVEAAAHFSSPAVDPETFAALLDGPHPPDAIVAIADHRLLPLLPLLKARGMKIPDDVAIIGGGDTYWAVFNDLTSTDRMDRELAAHTMAALEAEQNVSITVTPRIIFRGSCPAQ